MLTRAGFTLLGSAGGLLVAGLAAGNAFYATLALVPLGVLLAGFAMEPPYRARATLAVDKREPHAGDAVRVDVAYRVDAGAGPVELHVPLPEPFALVTGSNVHVAVKRAGKPLEGQFTFTFRATARGEHTVGPVSAEAVHGAGLRAPVTGEVAPAITLKVRPRDAGVRRIRGLAGIARTLTPDNDHAAAGVRTTEFRELREYAFGDPLKFVNWKATARRSAGEGGTMRPPLVNENEREGRKAVWLFLDAAAYMNVGTNVDNAFDHAVSAALGVAEHYLARGHRVGASVFNHPDAPLLHPDVGRRQILALTRLLTALRASEETTDGFAGGVARAKGFLLRERPLVVVVTRLGKADDATFDALKRLRALTGRRRRRIPVLVVNLVAAGSMPMHADWAGDVVQLVRRMERPAADRARRLGARVLDWDPSTERFARALLAQGRGWR